MNALEHHRRVVLMGKIIILVGWILVPMAYLLLQQFVAIVGWIAFGVGVLQLALTTIKYFGNPDRWIPGHKRKREEEAEKAHFVYHCARNPEGFARLRQENLERWLREREESPNQSPEPTSFTAPKS